MKGRPIVLLLSFALALVAWSCGKKGDQEKNSGEFADAQKSLTDEIKDLAYSIPPPSEIPYLLQSTGADFNQSLLSDNKKADSFTTQTDKAALNLGVYAADIGYLVSYEKTQESIDYLNTCKTLADNLGVAGSFDPNVLQAFEKNIGNRDSLGRLLDSEVKKIDEILKGDRSELAALLATGSFVESMYLATGLIRSYPKDILPDDKRNLVLMPLIRVVLDQKKSVSEVIRMLSSANQSGSIPTLLADLKALEGSYNALNVESLITNNKGKEVLSDKTLSDITDKYVKLRKDITQ